VLLLALIYIAVRHPRGRKDWEHDIRTSVYFIVTALLLITMLYVMYLAAGSIMLPPVVTMVIWLAVGMLILLVILGIFFPHGWKDARKG
jgi:small-conductance mechanosensitive channel